ASVSSTASAAWRRPTGTRFVAPSSCPTKSTVAFFTRCVPTWRSGRSWSSSEMAETARTMTTPNGADTSEEAGNLGGTGERTYAATPGDLPEGTLVELFLRAIDEFDKPDAMLRRTAERWEPISHRQLLEDARALYEGLAQLGVQRNDTVALM